MTSGGAEAERKNRRIGRDSPARRKLVFGLALAEDVLDAAVALVLIRRSPATADDVDTLD